MPSKATFNRLAANLDAGRHTFGAATTRRPLAAKPQGAYTVNLVARPGQHVHIDSTPLDVLALFDDGIGRRVDLVAAIDLATRTICMAMLRPAGVKAVDASLLLARMLVPEQMRPGWSEAAAMTASRLPFRSLEEIDARMRGAAAKPVIVPESIGTDRGKMYMSETFLRACENLGISLQPSRPRTSTDNAVIERTFESINTLFCQYVRGYVGRDAAHRGRDLDKGGLWSLAQLQDMLDQWVILGWQDRPHEGLESPDTGRVLSPNEMYAVLVAAAGYVSLMLTGDDYISLLPSQWRVVNDYGINLHDRVYNDPGLKPMRRRHSGVTPTTGSGRCITIPTTCPWCGCAITTAAGSCPLPGRTCRWSQLRSPTTPGAMPGASPTSAPPAAKTVRRPPPARWPTCWRRPATVPGAMAIASTGRLPPAPARPRPRTARRWTWPRPRLPRRTSTKRTSPSWAR